jgi:ATP-dependent exoDNAse (exonuclease V) beta subunit
MEALRLEALRGRARREVPFDVPGPQGRITGTIDLLLEDARGLRIVDYKTGRADLAERHVAQAALYAWAVAQVTGKVVADARLAYLSARPVRIETLDGEDLLRRAAGLLAAAR